MGCEWNRNDDAQGGRTIGWLLRGCGRGPCCWAVDRATVRPDGDYVGQLALGNVKLWKCENLAVWKYGNGLSVLMIAGGCLGIVCGDTCSGTEHLIRQAVATNFLQRQCTAYFYATCGKLHNTIFKFSFHSATLFSFAFHKKDRVPNLAV